MGGGLEPQLVRLVDHDEEHLVVRLRREHGALRALRTEHLVELEVVRVPERAVRGGRAHRERAVAPALGGVDDVLLCHLGQTRTNTCG